MKLANWIGIGCVVLLLGCGGAQQSVTNSDDPSSNSSKAEVPAPAKGANRADDSPAKVFDAYTRSIQAGEWKQAYACLTPAAQDMEVFELQFQLGAHGSEIPKRHEVPERVEELKKMEKEPSEEQLRSLMVGVLKNKEAFYVEAATHIADDLRRVSPEGPLRDVKISDSRARGIVTKRTFSSNNDGPLIGYPYDGPIYFSKGGRGWLIDFPSQEEQTADVEKMVIESESRPVEAYYHCPMCNTLQGGMYHDKPFKEFSGSGRKDCAHEWKEVSLRKFKELATKLHGFRWSDERENFWNRQ